MTCTSNAIRSDLPLPSTPLTIVDVVGNPRFAWALRDAALELIALHDKAPRIVRYVANLQKWLLTQAIIALHFEHATDPTRPGLNAANLIEFLVNNCVASKNTAVAHLAEMRNYRLLIELPSTADKRVRPLQIADIAEDLIRQWFNGHLKSLDLLDGGTRHEQSLSNPRLLSYAHPKLARRLFCHPGWCEPPETVSTFVRTESGSNILHDLISRLSPERALEVRIPIGPLRISELTKRYIISRSHAQRVFARARELDILGWEWPGNRGSFWLSEALVRDYRCWQAVKFSAIDEAFQWAVEYCSIMPSRLPGS
jgi:hypothetical protein